MELTYMSISSRIHNVRPILTLLQPHSGVRNSLIAVRSSPASRILHDYTRIMYSGLNSNTGENSSQKKIDLYLYVMDYFRNGVLTIFL